MPSKSGKQARFMAAAAHSPGFAQKAGMDPKVAKEFNQADKGSNIFKQKGGAPKPAIRKGAPRGR